MKPFVVRPVLSLKGRIFLPGDKSIAHRAIILSSIACKKTRIKNFPASKDCLVTLRAFKKLGIKITKEAGAITVSGKGLYGLKKPGSSIFLADSGTTLRLILGVLAAQHFQARLIVGRSLSQRPMQRVTLPLRLMGAEVNSKFKIQNSKREEYPPITIKGGVLKPISYRMPVASAQVKSAILLAGLYATGTTKIIEPISTRDHTERMLKLFKAEIKVKQNTIVIKGGRKLVSPGVIDIPGDISSAAFFMVLAAIIPNAQVVIRNISLNPSRTGIIKVLRRMGASIKITPSRRHAVTRFEPAGDIKVTSSRLKGTIVRRGEIPSLIDELPILLVAGCFAQGKTIFEGIEELRVKETDRIRSMSENLKQMGADLKISKHGTSEKIVIQGPRQLKGASVRSFSDHRTAMSMLVAGLNARGKTRLDDVSCINKSFPGFLSLLKKLIP